jgi:acyl-coenzyme A thioesterase PaaI-like protein
VILAHYVALVDVPAVLHGAEGFVRTLGARVLSSSPDQTVLRLDAGPELHNHVGGPHAAIIFGLGETTAFALLLEVFGDLVESGQALPLIKSGTISYSAIATGPMLATAHLVDDEASARASLADRGVATFDVEITFRRESDDVQTAVMTARMALKGSPPTG